MANDFDISVLNAEILTLRHLVYGMLVLYDTEQLMHIRNHIIQLQEVFDKLPEEAVMKLADTPEDIATVLKTAQPYGHALGDILNTLNLLIESNNAASY